MRQSHVLPINAKQGKIIKIDNTIAEFKDRVSKLKETSLLEDYEFVEKIKHKIDKIYKDLRKQMMKHIARYYFRAVTDQDSQKIIAKIKEYMQTQQNIERKKSKIVELEYIIENDFEALRKRL